MDLLETHPYKENYDMKIITVEVLACRVFSIELQFPITKRKETLYAKRYHPHVAVEVCN